LQFLGIAKLARLTLGKRTASPSLAEQIRTDVIQQLRKTPGGQTVDQVIAGISRDINRQYTPASANEMLDDLAIEGLVVKAEARGHCRYRCANCASELGNGTGERESEYDSLDAGTCGGMNIA
jgi:hypothetical protein